MLPVPTIYGIIATQEVAYAKKKPVCHSPYRRRADRVNQACKQIYVTIYYGRSRQDDPSGSPGAQQ